MSEIIPYSKLGKTERQKLVDLIPMKNPFTLFIEPTNICNFRCVQCPHGLENYNDIAGPVQNMNFDCFNKIVSDLKEWRGIENNYGPFLKVIRLYLEGEPFCNSSICEMLEILKENKFAERIEIVTNGSLLTKEICEKLVKYQLDYIKVSIYSVNEEKNEKITNSCFTPDKIRENIKLLKTARESANSLKPFIHVKIIDTYNSTENDEFKEYYSGIADEICIDKPMNWNNSDDSNFIDNLYQNNSEKVKQYISEEKVRKACPFPFHTIAIKSNGDIIVCCVDWLRTTKIGNIMNNTLQEIWNGREMYNFRKMHIEGNRKDNESCKNCELLNTLPEEDNVDDFKIEEL